VQVSGVNEVSKAGLVVAADAACPVQDYLERAAREASQARKRGKGADSGGAGDEARARAEDMRSRQQQLKHMEVRRAAARA